MDPQTYFERMRDRDRARGVPELPIRATACHDCAVTTGFYAEFSEDLSKLDPALVDEVSRRWWCHNNPDKACRGNADVCGVQPRPDNP